MTDKTKILITGANGQLGKSIQKIAGSFSGLHFFYTDVDDLDITQKQAVFQYLQINPVDVVVNCAAYTAVDRAEEEPEKANLINHDAVRNLAQAARQFGASLIHISTDYVFDGTAKTPYKEEDKTSPLGVYGRTKLLGEQAVLNENIPCFIIRTSWLYSEFGKNFVKTMIRLMQDKEEISVVCDQYGSPTYATDLAKAILKIIPQMSDEASGIYHFANQGSCSWHEFAVKIKEFTGSDCKLNAIATENYPTKAERPKYSVFDTQKIQRGFQLQIPKWERSLQICVNGLIS